VAAGPIGRQARASSDLKLNAQILSYSRSKGFFAELFEIVQYWTAIYSRLTDHQYGT
jgi:hypothetical protein